MEKFGNQLRGSFKTSFVLQNFLLLVGSFVHILIFKISKSEHCLAWNAKVSTKLKSWSLRVEYPSELNSPNIHQHIRQKYSDITRNIHQKWNIRQNINQHCECKTKETPSAKCYFCFLIKMRGCQKFIWLNIQRVIYVPAKGKRCKAKKGGERCVPWLAVLRSMLGCCHCCGDVYRRNIKAIKGAPAVILSLTVVLSPINIVWSPFLTSKVK